MASNAADAVTCVRNSITDLLAVGAFVPRASLLQAVHLQARSHLPRISRDLGASYARGVHLHLCGGRGGRGSPRLSQHVHRSLVLASCLESSLSSFTSPRPISTAPPTTPSSSCLWTGGPAGRLPDAADHVRQPRIRQAATLLNQPSSPLPPPSPPSWPFGSPPHPRPPRHRWQAGSTPRSSPAACRSTR